MMVVVTVVGFVMSVVSVRSTMSMIVMPMRVIHLIATGVAAMGTDQRDNARDQRADQWQENNRLNHNPVSPSSG
jgi:hypothetical protein